MLFVSGGIFVIGLALVGVSFMKKQEENENGSNRHAQIMMSPLPTHETNHLEVV